MIEEMYKDYLADTLSFYECCVYPDGSMLEEDREYYERRVLIQTSVHERLLEGGY